MFDQYIFSTPSQVYFTLALICLALPLFIWKKRGHISVRKLLYLYLSLFVWSFGLIFESAATHLEGKLLWSQIAYFGTVFSPLFVFAFAEAYTQVYLIRRRWIWLLLTLIPFFTLVLSWTNNQHDWLWPSITIMENNLAVYEHGIGFWIFFIYTYCLIVPSFLLLLNHAVRLQRIYRIQSFLILLATGFVITGNILYLIPNNPIPGMEWTLVGIIICTLILVLGILRFKLFNIVPTARSVLVETMADGVFMIDRDNQIVDLNPSFLILMGLKPDMYLGRPYDEVLHSCPSMIALLSEDFSGRGNVRSQVNHNNKILDVRITNLGGLHNQEKGRLIVISDITSIKQSEIALKKSNELLSKEIAVRQKLITELDAYAHTVAHDLKIPLSGLVGFAELLKEDLEENELKNIAKYSAQIEESANNMIHIVNELLMLSSVRSQDVHEVAFDLGVCLSQAKKQLAESIAQSGTEITEPAEWPLAIGHAAWIKEVWVNYLSNAIKYGGQPPRIELGYEVLGDQIKCWVCDNGEGLSPEQLNQLFKPYSRLSNSDIEGQGLGLSIVKRILDRLGGTAGASSLSDRPGSCFFFILPTPPRS